MADTKISALPASTTPLAGTEVLPLVQSGATKQVSVSNLTAGRAVPMSSLGVNVASIIGTAAIGVPSTTNIGKLSDAGTNYIGAGSLGNYAQVTAGAYSASAVNYAPVAWGYIATDTSGSNKGDFFVATRSATTDTAPSIRFRFTSDGNLVPSTAAKGINFTANSAAAGMTSQLLNWYEEGTWTPNQGGGLTLVGAFSSAGSYTRIGRQVFIRGSVSGATSIAVASAGAITTNLPYSSAADSTGAAINAANNASSVLRISSATITAATAIAATATITFSAVYSV